MAKPMRTNNPSEWTALDGVYIDEILPPGRITGRGSAIVSIVGLFQMGEYTPLAIKSAGHLVSAFGSGNYTGYVSLSGKTFSNLVVQRVKTATAKAASILLKDSNDVASIKCEALYDGVYGNDITAQVLAATSLSATACNILVTIGSKSELFENVTLTSLPLTGAYVKLTKDAGALLIPEVAVAANLTLGVDGTAIAADYIAAIEKLEMYEGITIVFTDDGTVDVNNALITHCNKMGDRYPILHHEAGTTKAEIITAANQYRSALDRGSLAFPHLYQYISELDKTVLTNPAAWAASVISQIPEECDPAISTATQYLTGVKGLEFEFGRTDYIELKNAGVMAFEFDSDLGYKIKSGITLSLDASRTMVFRRRMADLITSDIGSGLKPYQNKPMNEDNITDALGSVTKYLDDKKTNKRIEIYLVDGESMNTEASTANGEFHILIKVKLFSSMRYIILHAQVGEGILIVEGGVS